MLLSHHERDFFAAYKTHMAQVQKDFRDLKQKADQKETKARRDAKYTDINHYFEYFDKLFNLKKKNQVCIQFKSRLFFFWLQVILF